jgi:hypothetical protein
MTDNEPMLVHALTTPVTDLELPEDVPNLTQLRDLNRDKYVAICSAVGVDLESYRAAADFIMNKFGNYISKINPQAHCMMVVDFVLNHFFHMRSGE